MGLREDLYVTVQLQQMSGTVEDLLEGLDDALAEAELPALLPAVAHLTGDLGILEPGLRAAGVSQVVGQAPQGGLTPEAQDRARLLIRTALRRWAAAGCPVVEHDAESTLTMLRFVAGDVGADQLPLLYHQLGMEAPGEAAARPAPAPEGFRVAVIGAGMSGIAASRHLQAAGIDHVVLERHDEVGGVWLENTYPGVRLDTSNFCYSYSFAQRDAWEDYYSPGTAVAKYLSEVADDLHVRDHVRFATTVRSAAYDESSGRWRLELDTAAGEETLWADAVISAVGQLNTPLYPTIPGLDSFAGDSWHTARWNGEVDLAGKRVAVIGTGASAFQVIPQIAADVSSLTVFQRTPPWVVPTPTYTRKLRPGLRWLFRMIPGYQRWYRFVQFWTNVEGRRRYALVDPAWDTPGSISADSESLRQALIAQLERDYEGRPDLLAKMTPDYPPYAKRMLRDDGTWAATLRRDNVEIVTDHIAAITPTGIRTAAGREVEVDVIIYGTGFTASDFLSTIEVTGRDGADLHRQWADDARAYAGITVPNFPNLFLLYGPNTNLVVNGSIVFFSEAEVEYVMSCLSYLFEHGLTAMEPTSEALEDYYVRLDEASARTAYGLAGVTSWYKSRSGRVTQNWPLTTLEFWEMTRAPDSKHYRFW